jgi:hypothetical protein
VARISIWTHLAGRRASDYQHFVDNTVLIDWNVWVPSNNRSHASTLAAYRAVLGTAGGDDLTPRPWQRTGQPVGDCDLVRLAAWKAADADVDPELVSAGLGLISAARSELDQIEAALLFAARAAGVTFQQIATALGLGSGQAAQQRMSRVLTRLDSQP